MLAGAARRCQVQAKSSQILSEPADAGFFVASAVPSGSEELSGNTALAVARRLRGKPRRAAVERRITGRNDRCGSRCVPLLVIPALRERRIVVVHGHCGSSPAPRDTAAGGCKRRIPGRNGRCGSRCAPLLVIPAVRKRRIVGVHSPCGSSPAPWDSHSGTNRGNTRKSRKTENR